MLDLKGFCVGSPPHGRGKDCRSLALGCQLGITPAWAGKSRTASRETIRIQDHPRIGGEKRARVLHRPDIVGSPPHGRGKVHPDGPEKGSGGITPAWAGKRQTRAVHGRRDKDHPRVGGEKLHLDVFCNNCEGSPPRGRGKVSTCCLLSPLDRITPAWAGKRYYPFAVILLDRDHPRVGGEKSPVRIKALPNSGSPPRGRGKAHLPGLLCTKTGITPAWAGKRRCFFIACSRGWDHPRVGGEKFFHIVFNFSTLGSPPRGRGKVTQVTKQEQSQGITPAWAGKSYSIRCGESCTKDHPRVGGEKFVGTPM